jgi:protein-S-isoprenylcysteine O-methyltransferase Ste14
MRTVRLIRETIYEASVKHPIVTWAVVGSAWATLVTLCFGFLGAALTGSPKHGLQLTIYVYFVWLVVGLVIVGPGLVLWNRRTERRSRHTSTVSQHGA